MTTRNILKDFSNDMQPNLQLLDAISRNWRMYFHQTPIIPESPDDADGQWQADFVPQTWQADLVSDGEPEASAFVPMLKDWGLTDEEINLILTENE